MNARLARLRAQRPAYSGTFAHDIFRREPLLRRLDVSPAEVLILLVVLLAIGACVALSWYRESQARDCPTPPPGWDRSVDADGTCMYKHARRARP